MLELSGMIRALRQELRAAMEDGRDESLRFALGAVEVEATVAVEKEAGAGGKVRFWVVEADAHGRLAKAETQRITLTLHPKVPGPDGTLRDPLIADDELPGER